MKQVFLTLFLACFFLGPVFSQQNYLDTIWSGGIMRTFRVYVPAIYSGQTSRPLVFQFHGEPGASSSMENFTRFKSVADTANFILVTPDGTVDPGFPQYGQGWNVYICCRTVDDVLFVSDMTDALQSQYNIDSTRIYATGYSNGGMMSYELACQLSNRIAAIASVAGTVVNSKLSSCSPSRALSVLEIHGTDDPVLPYEGKIFGIDTFSSIDTILKFWASHDQCSPAPVFTPLPDINTTDGSTVERYVFPDCANGSSVELLKVLGGRHAWPGLPYPNTNQDIIADQEIWRFFLHHKLGSTNSKTDELVSDDFNIYPNPAIEFINVAFDVNLIYNKIESLSVFDAYGRQVLFDASPKSDKPIRIDVTGLANGLYFLEIKAAGFKHYTNHFTVMR